MNHLSTDQLLAELDAIECKIKETCNQLAIAGREHPSPDRDVNTHRQNTHVQKIQRDELRSSDPLASLRQLLHENIEE